ncbi:MAG TPA: GNAT family N-acetyltransferase [Candidatus Limnocylindrales bacterium]|jgi:GNAT superfamily N-acetyltransferase|nr:GNAT family N-acetyltransferase [Candidatus Limnocylindrales bacterium]
MTADGVRAATAEDAPAVARVHVDTWRAAYAGVVPQAVLDGLSVERREAFWRKTVEEPGDHRLWVAESAGQVVGFASTGPGRDDDLPAGAGELMAIYVAPAAWGEGFGARLFRHAIADLRERNIHPVVLWVLTDNPRGRNFYEAMGWQPDGAVRPIDFGGIAVEEIRYRSAPPGPPDAPTGASAG